MKLFFTALIFLSLVRPVLANDWDVIDKNLLTVLAISHTVDCLQTQYIFDNPRRNELNPIIRDGVNKYGKSFIPAYFLVTTLCTALIADWLPSDYRKPWLGIWVGSSISTIYRNHILGIRLHF